MDDILHAEELMSLFGELDEDGSQTVSLDEFRTVSKHPRLKSYLQIRGIDIKNAESFFNMLLAIAGEDSEIDLQTLVTACLRMKGLASNIDLQTLSFEVKVVAKRQQSQFNKVSEQLQALVQAMSQLQGAVGSFGEQSAAPDCRPENSKRAVRL